MRTILRYIVGTPGVFTADLSGHREPRPGERVIGIRTQVDDDLIRRPKLPPKHPWNKWLDKRPMHCTCLFYGGSAMDCFVHAKSDCQEAKAREK